MLKNKTTSLQDLVVLANSLDSQGLQKEADTLDSFIKTASLLEDISAWIAGKMDDARLARIANELGAERLAAVAKKMDPQVQKELISQLAMDPEVAQLAAEAIVPGLPPELSGQLGGAASELMEMMSGQPTSLQRGDSMSSDPSDVSKGLAQLQDLFNQSR